MALMNFLSTFLLRFLVADVQMSAAISGFAGFIFSGSMITPLLRISAVSDEFASLR